MDLLKIFVFAIFLSSCAKIVYVAQQFPEQMFLIYGSRDNEEILNDPSVPDRYKDKIIQIQKLKKHFFKFMKKEESEIYSKTTLLNRNAVSYLVIASKYYQIEAKQECFPFVGCFPYLGFFDKDDAIKYAKKLEKNDYQTWVRPVYAYSSLNYFTDPILSSFFSYTEFELAELIFHELFHTIFFIKDEVDFNENIANYFARKMSSEYFNLNKKQIENNSQQRRQQEEIAQTLTDLTLELKDIYAKEKQPSRAKSEKILSDFLEKRFIIEIRKKCQSVGVNDDNCYPLKRSWNNASLAAFLTYEKEADYINKYHQKIGLSLKSFYTHLEKKYKEYQDKEVKTNFRDYLLKR